MADPLTDELLSGLNVALSESNLHDAQVRADRREAIVLFTVLSLPEVGPEPDDRRLILRLAGGSRVAASLRHGRWEDAAAEVEQFALSDLSDVVRSFSAQPIYGWEFLDPSPEGWERWEDRLSLDMTLSAEDGPHVLELFQESAAGPPRHLDLRLWFSALAAYDFGWNAVPLTQVMTDGRRWWDRMYAGDPRTEGHGIVPSRSPKGSD